MLIYTLKKYDMYRYRMENISLFEKLKRHTDNHKKMFYSRFSVFTMESLEHNVMNLTSGHYRQRTQQSHHKEP